MAVDINNARQALATAAEATGITGVTYLADSIEPPLFEVGEVSIDFDRAEYIDVLAFTCRLYVSVATDTGAQPELDKYMQRAGEFSIKAALEADHSLAGTCRSMRVSKIDGYRIYSVAGTRYLGAQVMVTVMG